MKDFSGKVAVVTGGANGIGLALARELAARGCQLSLADIDEDHLAHAQTSLQSRGVQVLTSVVDVGVLSDVEMLATATLDRYGTVDVLINNAGVIAWNPIDALTIGEWRWVIDVNLWGTIHGLHVFLPILEAKGSEAHIVNMASTGGVLADVPYMGTYSATKGAVIGLSLTLAAELRIHEKPIGVTIVCPSGTRGGDAHLAERNRPDSLGRLKRLPEVQALFDVVARQITQEGQPADVVAQRVVDSIERNDLWAFPHPEADWMVQPRLASLSQALRASGKQTIS